MDLEEKRALLKELVTDYCSKNHLKESELMDKLDIKSLDEMPRWAVFLMRENKLVEFIGSGHYLKNPDDIHYKALWLNSNDYDSPDDLDNFFGA